jgi:autotransporter-associated beta strand protein
LKLAACLLVVVCLAAAAQAGPLVISVNFGAEEGEAGTALSVSESAGFIPATNWKNVYSSSGSASLCASDGTTPGGTVSWSSSGDWNTNGSTSTPDSTMMYGYLDAGNGNRPAIITFSGLPSVISPLYDVYVYVAGDSAGKLTGDYTIGGTTIWATQGSSTSAYTLASNGTAGNYIEFPCLSGSSFRLVAAASSTNSTFVRAPVDGIQIVQLPALTWTGSQSCEWSTYSIAGPKNWQDPTGAAADYADHSPVCFDDSAGTTTVDILAADVTPYSVTFSNSATTYTLQSSGGFGIAGTSGLMKSGGGLLTISNTNKFTGPVTFGGGTIAVASVANGGVNSPLGAGGSLIFDGGTLEYAGVDPAPATNRSVTVNSGGTIQVDNASTNLVLNGAISGSGSLTKAGPGTLTLSGGNYAYTGQIFLTNGALAINSPVPTGPGLYEGLVSTSSYQDTTDPIPLTSIQPVARWGTSTTADHNPIDPNRNVYPNWGDDTTWGYSGYLDNKSNSPVTYTFGKNFDDAAFLVIDGVSVINDLVYSDNVTASITLGPGFHSVDLRLGQGSGGVGPYTGAYNSFGVSYNTLGITATSSAAWLQMGAGDANTQFFAAVAGAPSSALVMSASTTLDLSATNVGWVLLGSLADAPGCPTGHQVLLGSNTLDVGLDNSSTTFSGAISGSGGRGGTLVKDGAGTLTLLGDDTGIGATVVDDGTLVLASSAALAPGTNLTVEAGALLIFGAPLAGTPERAASPAGRVAVPEPGTLALLGGAGVVAAARWRRKRARRVWTSVLRRPEWKTRRGP